MKLTIEQWLDLLPEPHRSRALKNYAHNDVKLYTSMDIAIRSAFYWNKVPEDIKYWSDLARREWDVGELLQRKRKIIISKL